MEMREEIVLNPEQEPVKHSYSEFKQKLAKKYIENNRNRVKELLNQEKDVRNLKEKHVEQLMQEVENNCSNLKDHLHINQVTTRKPIFFLQILIYINIYKNFFIY